MNNKPYRRNDQSEGGHAHIRADCGSDVTASIAKVHSDHEGSSSGHLDQNNNSLHAEGIHLSSEHSENHPENDIMLSFTS